MSESPPPQHTSSDYWTLARDPITCLVFLFPILIAYECGVFLMGGDHPDLLRNGAVHWLRSFLVSHGATFPALLPVLVVFGLVAWQILGQYPWRVRIDTLVGMGAESLLFAFALIVMGQAQDLVFQNYVDPIPVSDSTPLVTRNPWLVAVPFLGAGIYEEFLFRLIGIPTGVAAFRLILFPKDWAQRGAVIATGILFAAAHYVGPGAEPLQAFSFVFRLVAALFFGTLFICRGFGVTVGAHATYDILVGVMLKLDDIPAV